VIFTCSGGIGWLDGGVVLYAWVLLKVQEVITQHNPPQNIPHGVLVYELATRKKIVHKLQRIK